MSWFATEQTRWQWPRSGCRSALAVPRWRRGRRVAGVVQRWRSDRGNVVVLFAAALAALLGMGALVADVGLLYLERGRLQDAVDSAALAGVQELPGDPTAARTRALEYAERNGIAEQHVDVEVASDGYKITVRANRPMDLYFARILGFHTANVGARAGAATGILARTGGAVPLGVEKQNWEYNELYELKYGSGEESGSYRGNFAPLALGGRGSGQYMENLKYGYADMVEAGTWVDTEPGNMKGNTRDGVHYRINQDAGTCSFENVSNRCSRLVVTPIIESLEVSGRSDVKVVGFAAFYLEFAESDGSVHGRFIEAAIDGEYGEAEDYGARSHGLVD